MTAAPTLRLAYPEHLRGEVESYLEEIRFSAERMAEDYLGLYRRLAVKTRPALRIVT